MGSGGTEVSFNGGMPQGWRDDPIDGEWLESVGFERRASPSFHSLKEFTTMIRTTTVANETGGCVASGKVLEFRSSTFSMPDEILATLLRLSTEVDATLASRAFQYPANQPQWVEICDLLRATVPEGLEWGARFGIGQLWDVRLEVSRYGSISSDRCRQGWLESSAEFWQA